MIKDKMSSRPPVKTVEDFIKGAENKTAPKEINKDNLPWLSPEVRQNGKKAMLLQLYEPCLLKIKFIADNTKYSQQEFVREVLEKVVDEKIKSLLDI